MSVLEAVNVRDFLGSPTSETYSLARLAAIPNRFDAPLLAAMLGLSRAADAEIEKLDRAGLLLEQGTKYSVHPMFRPALLGTWWQTLDDFRAACARGAAHYGVQAESSTLRASLSDLREAVFLALGANHSSAPALLEAVFALARNTYQLGVCEQLVTTPHLIEPALSDRARQTIRFLQAELSLLYYRFDEAEKEFQDALAMTTDAVRQDLARLGLGRVYLARHDWEEAFKQLHAAEAGFGELNQPYYQAQARLALARCYDDLAERSGGLYSGDEEKVDPFVHARRSVDNLPFALVRFLLLRVPFLEWLYFRAGTNPRSRFGQALSALFFGSHYQDWIIIKLKVQAVDRLRQAAKTFYELGYAREGVEAEEQLSWLYHLLGHPRAAGQLQDKLLNEDEVKRSEYLEARVRLVRGRMHAEGGRFENALQDLAAAREVLERYSDWNLAGTGAELIGHIYEREGKKDEAVKEYGEAVEAFGRAQDVLRRTEVTGAREDLQAASGATEPVMTTEPMAFITRFPGELYQRVQRGTLFSMNGVTWLVLLVTWALIGFVALVEESLIRFKLQHVDLGLDLSDYVLLAITPFLPLLPIWSYRLVYALIGGAMWSFRVPLSVIEADAPEIISLEADKLRRKNFADETTESLNRSDEVGVVLAERSVWGGLIRLGSHVLVVTRASEFRIEATTRFYSALKKRLEAHVPKTAARLDASVDYVRSWWLAALVIVALALALLVPPIISIPATCVRPEDCPKEVVRLSVSTPFEVGLIIFGLLTPLVLIARNRLQVRRINALVDEARAESTS
jgi:predicted negative regulator of RcsB-dependent stress response